MKKFYVTVQKLSSTTKFGLLLSAPVYAKYNEVLLSEDQLPGIFADILEWTAAIRREHPTMKAMHIHSHGFLPSVCGYGRLSGSNDAPQIWMSVSKAPTTETRKPFVIYLSPVKIDYTQEGGEL